MNVNKNYGAFSGYFAVFGIIVLLIGVAEIIVSLTGGCFEYGPLIVCDEEDFLIWRGLILLFSGLFITSSVNNMSDVHQQAKLVMGNIMIWLVGGMALLGMILGSIPGPEDGTWFNTFSDLVASYGGPYMPSLVLLPFTVIPVLILYRTRIRGQSKKN
ncbi:MAG TPA: hypothetical protein PK718_08900 [Candidatus Methanofastidiosa archaeon]|nr:hypothetical protein [Candidatus Methanofastidiosa archaeon]HPR42641.1 hypothetical protein [Candidatus Methanofastidiosa archaeon]